MARTKCGPKGPHTDQEYRTAVCSAIEQAFRKREGQPGWSRREVAEKLGVTPMSLSKYLRGLSTPKPSAIHQACRLFGIVINYKGAQLGAGAFSQSRHIRVTQAQQLELLGRIRREHLKVSVLDVFPEEDGVRVELRLGK